MCVHTCMGTCAMERPEVDVRGLPQLFSVSLFNKVFHKSRAHLFSETGWPANSRESSFLYLSSVEMTGVYHSTWLCYVVSKVSNSGSQAYTQALQWLHYLPSPVSLPILSFFKIQSLIVQFRLSWNCCYVAQADLKFKILLPQLPET